MARESANAIAGEPSAGLPPALRRRLHEAFQRGRSLSAQRNFDYAHELFAQCVINDPANLVFVETMIANLRAKFGGDKKKVRHGLSLGSGRGLSKAIARQDWPEATRLGLEQLKTDPWQVATLRGLAEVCAALHHNEVELGYLKQALEASPKDAEVNRHCARSLARMGQFDQAIACWHRVELIRPGDKEATKMVFQLNEEKLWHSTAMRERASQIAEKVAAVVESPTEEVAQEPQEVKLSRRQLLERAISEDPTHVEHYLDLAELLIDGAWLSEAESVLEHCLVACGEDSRISEQMERVRLLRLEQQQPTLVVRDSAEESSTRLPWLEMVLACSAVALVLQFAPGLMSGIASAITSHWRSLALVASILLVPLLFLLRPWQARSMHNAESLGDAKVVTMPSAKSNDQLIFWTSIALAVIVCLVVIPLIPVFWPRVHSLLVVVGSMLDVRAWSRLTWFIMNLVGLAILVVVRFGRGWKRAWR